MSNNVCKFDIISSHLGSTLRNGAADKWGQQEWGQMGSDKWGQR